jgi:protein-disulfide isomerase
MTEPSAPQPAAKPLRFAVTYDYRCPFARNAHEHLIDGLQDAATSWDVHFVPLSLSQLKDPLWDVAEDSGLLALHLSIAVRDGQPDRFLATHRALFAIRHDRGLNQRDPEILAATLLGAGVDVEAALAFVHSGEAAEIVRREHEEAVNQHQCWGVPTFIVGDHAAFVRLMDRPEHATVPAVEAVERLVGMLDGWPALNEFKHTSLQR